MLCMFIVFQCEGFVQQYTPQLVQWLEHEDDPFVICRVSYRIYQQISHINPHLIPLFFKVLIVKNDYKHVSTNLSDVSSSH